MAYGPDEILYVLLLAGAAGTQLDMPVAGAITALLAVVALSYRQTIHAYPRGGGSYTVAGENLGRAGGLVAAAALIVDYVTTIAVSVTAGVEAIIAFVPGVGHYRVICGLACILLLVLVNLRGVREAGAIFVAPTFLFIGSLALLLVVGAVRYAVGSPPHPLHPVAHASEAVTVFLVLRAFAGGCTAMTGIEAIANGVPVFRPPEARNAAATLGILAAILAVLFLGVAALGLAVHAHPSNQANVLAQIGQSVAGASNPLYYVVQVSAAIVLLLAANTSFNGFPRLAAIMAKADYLPHQFSHRGLRLAYSNGIVVIALVAGVLVVAFGGQTHALIPLFAVGVFLCFTLSQAGMVVHWLREQGARWRTKLAVNAAGALATGMVTIVVVATKFSGGAWIVVVLVPMLVALFWAINRQYETTRRELASPPPRPAASRPRVVLPVQSLNRATAAALEYSLSITDRERVVAVHISSDDEPEDFAREWRRWAGDIHLHVEPSPYREVLGPLLRLVDRLRVEGDGPLTVVLPEVIGHHWWEEPLHNQLGLAVKLALLYRPGVALTSVPVRLRR